MLSIFALLFAGTNAASFFPNSTTSSLSCPTTTSGQASSLAESIFSLQNPYGGATDPANELCEGEFGDSFRSWLGNAINLPSKIRRWDGIASIPMKRSGTDIRTSQLLITALEKSVENIYTWTASQPCCWTCSIFGGNVGPATMVDQTGFTFTSPSIYVAFKSLYATDFCGDFGTRIPETTLAFGPDDLFTNVGYQWDTSLYSPMSPWFSGQNTFTQANWANHLLANNFVFLPNVWFGFPNIAAASSWLYDQRTSNQCLSVQGYESVLHSEIDYILRQGKMFTITYDPCSPTLSVPSPLLTLQPAWSNCVKGVRGFFDPPSTLTPGTGFKTDGIFAPAASQAAAPGPVPVPATPTPTPDAKPSAAPNSPVQPATDNPPALGNPPANSQTAAPGDLLADAQPVPSAPGANSAPLPPQPQAANINPPNSPPAPGTQQQPADPQAGGPLTQSPADPAPSAYILGSQTLVPGAPAMTVSSIPISLQPDGSNIVLGTGSKTLPINTLLNAVSSATSNGDGDVSVLSAVLASITPVPLPGPLPLPLGSASIILSGTTLALSITTGPNGLPTVILDAKTEALTAFAAEYAGASVVIDGTTEALTAFLGQITSSGGSSLIAAQGGDKVTGEGGLGGIIATMGGFGPVSVSKSAPTTYLQAGVGGAVSGSGNGTFVGGAGGLHREGIVWITATMISTALLSITIL